MTTTPASDGDDREAQERAKGSRETVDAARDHDAGSPLDHPEDGGVSDYVPDA